jgi:hypothetical protein
MLDDILNKTQEDNQDFGNLKFFLKKNRFIAFVCKQKDQQRTLLAKKTF